jgi:hypothetical protein
MDIITVRAFFKWCTIVNFGLLIFTSLFIRFAREWIFWVHTHWIPMTEDDFNVAIYMLLGIFKLLVIVFNLVPYIALVIIGRNQPYNQSAQPTSTR